MLVVRHRIGRWLAAATAGLVAAAALSGAVADAESARADWGTPVEVVVSDRLLRTGEVVTADAVAVTAVPARLVPDDAISDPPLGLRVVSEVGPGEILVARRLSSGPGSAAAIALPDGTRGVTLDRSQVFGDVGDAVDLHALVSGAPLTQGVVVHTDETSATVAVTTADAAAVVDAISQGGVVSVLVP
jgi:Flp pilus assembly protein CpaB